ncbi:MAG: hypothetical protein ABI354_01770, partial [Candidatus Saccharimonadales bacterium]
NKATTTANKKQTTKSQVSDVSIGSLGDSYDSFFGSGIKEFIPSKKQSTLDAYKDLASGFDLDDKFPASKSVSLATLGIAYLYSSNKDQKDGYRAELYQLASGHLKSLPSDIKDDTFSQSTQSPKDTVAIFDKYKDTTLSSSMEKTITSSGLANEVTTNLKLNNVNDLVKYKVVVMNFDTGSSGQKKFASEHYMFGADPTMWVESVGGDAYILFAKNYATDFIADANGDTRHKVIHEFIHAQSPFLLGDLGHSIEERRAELFSGDLSSYYDAKQMFIYTEVFSGISMNDMLEAAPTSPADFYMGIYSKFGVKTANDIIGNTPVAYLSDPSYAVSQTQALIDSMDGLTAGAIDIGQKDKPAMEARMKTRTDKLFKVFKTKDKVIRDFDNNVSGGYGLHLAAQTMKDYINSHY